MIKKKQVIKHTGYLKIINAFQINSNKINLKLKE